MFDGGPDHGPMPLERFETLVEQKKAQLQGRPAPAPAPGIRFQVPGTSSPFALQLMDEALERRLTGGEILVLFEERGPGRPGPHCAAAAHAQGRSPACFLHHRSQREPTPTCVTPIASSARSTGTRAMGTTISCPSTRSWPSARTVKAAGGKPDPSAGGASSQDAPGILRGHAGGHQEGVPRSLDSRVLSQRGPAFR